MPASRREFLLTIAGSAAGRVFLSRESPIEAGAGATDGLPAVRLLTVPTRTMNPDGSWLLVWMEETEDGVRPMMWHPETPEEIAEATAFYEAAVNHEGVPGVEQPPKTIAGKVGRWLRDLVEPDPRQRSDEEWALLWAIVADPDSTAPLLRYADWLTSQGSPQGEFIRLDCEAEPLALDDPRRAQIDERWTPIYEEHGKDFVAPLKKLGIVPVMAGRVFPGLSLKRGVIGRVEIEKPGIVPEKMDDLFALAPLIDELWLSFPKVKLAEIVQRPQFAQIASLRASGTECGIDAAALKALAESPHTGRLRELDFGFNPFGPEGARWLARGPFLPRLASLEVWSCQIGPDGLLEFVTRDGFDRLRKLVLANNDLDGDSIALLCSCSSLRSLEHLDLHDNRNAWDGLPALADATFSASIRTLNLGGMNPIAAEIGGFSRGRYGKLESLNFSSSRMEDDGLALLADGEWCAGLRELELSHNEFTPAAGDLLAKTQFRRIERLCLSGSPLGDEGLAALLRSPFLSTLKDLELRDCGIGPTGVRALVAAMLPKLERLVLAGNDIGPDGGRMLAETQAFQLTQLWVDKKSIGNSARKRLKERYGDGMVFS